jgi:hypothetical protein
MLTVVSIFGVILALIITEIVLVIANVKAAPKKVKI